MIELNATLGRASSAHPDDVRAVKRRLAGLGLYEPPTGEVHAFPDAELFEGVEAFQRRYGLRVDGIMKPGGPTEAAMNGLAEPKEGENAYQRGVRLGLLRPDDAGDETETWDRALERQTGMRPSEAAFPLVLAIPPVASALAQAGAVLLPGLLGGAALIAGQKALRARKSDEPTDAGGSKFEALPPAKPEPHRGPSQEEIERLNKELGNPPPGRPAAPIEVTPEIFPTELPKEPQILIFPDMAGEIPVTILENRKGNDRTKAQIDRIRDWFLDRDWTHVAGGRKRGKNKEVPEFWVPSIAKDFGGDGRIRGRFVDLTMKSPDGQIVHIQTVTLDKNGKPTAAELEAAEDIRRRTGAHVILVPKTWQLRSGGRGK